MSYYKHWYCWVVCRTREEHYVMVAVVKATNLSNAREGFDRRIRKYLDSNPKKIRIVRKEVDRMATGFNIRGFKEGLVEKFGQSTLLE